MSSLQMQETYTECEAAMKGIEDAATVDALTAAETQLNKVQRNWEKKKARVGNMLTVDREHLDFQIKLDDFFDHMGCFLRLISAFKKYKPSEKTKKASTVAKEEAFDELRVAMKEVIDIDRKIPVVVIESKYEIEIREAIAKNNVTDFAAVLERAEEKHMRKSRSEFVEVLPCLHDVSPRLSESYL